MEFQLCLGNVMIISSIPPSSLKLHEGLLSLVFSVGIFLQLSKVNKVDIVINISIFIKFWNKTVVTTIT